MCLIFGHVYCMPSRGSETFWSCLTETLGIGWGFNGPKPVWEVVPETEWELCPQKWLGGRYQEVTVNGHTIMIFVSTWNRTLIRIAYWLAEGVQHFEVKMQQRGAFLIVKQINICSIYSQILVNFYRGEIESILTQWITNWHGWWTTLLYQSTEHQCHRWSEVSAQSSKDTQRQHPPQKYPLLYHQTTEQLLPSGCDTHQFILSAWA